MKYLLLIAPFIFFIGCKNSRVQTSIPGNPGMFKISIFYPNGDDKTFDMDYYEKKHMPMVAGFLGQNLAFYEIDKGISGRAAGDKPTYMAIGYFYITNIDEYNKAIGQHRDEIVNDFKNYTNTQPIIQISELKQLVRQQ